jgi:hypothetical protein
MKVAQDIADRFITHDRKLKSKMLVETVIVYLRNNAALSLKSKKTDEEDLRLDLGKLLSNWFNYCAYNNMYWTVANPHVLKGIQLRYTFHPAHEKMDTLSATIKYRTQILSIAPELFLTSNVSNIGETINDLQVSPNKKLIFEAVDDEAKPSRPFHQHANLLKHETSTSFSPLGSTIPDHNLTPVRHNTSWHQPVAQNDSHQFQQVTMKNLSDKGYGHLEPIRRKFFDIPPFCGTESPVKAQQWLLRFERTTFNKKPQLRCISLVNMLEDIALDWHSSIDEDYELEWPALREKFMIRFVYTIQSATRELANLKLNPKESLEALLSRARMLGKIAQLSKNDITLAFRRALPQTLHKFSAQFLTSDDLFKLDKFQRIMIDRGEWQSSLSQNSDQSDRDNFPTGRTKKFIHPRHSSDKLPISSDSTSTSTENESFMSLVAMVNDLWPIDGILASQATSLAQTDYGQHILDSQYCTLAASKDEDWSHMACDVCLRKGHPTNKCFQRCRMCDLMNPNSLPHHQDKHPCPIADLYRNSEDLRQAVTSRLRLNKGAL